LVAILPVTPPGGQSYPSSAARSSAIRHLNPDPGLKLSLDRIPVRDQKAGKAPSAKKKLVKLPRLKKLVKLPRQ
jgi:hypothetical protein